MKTAHVRDPAGLLAILKSASVEDEISKAIIANAVQPGTVESDAELGALIGVTDDNNRIVKVTSARLKNWALNWKAMLFDVAPSIATAATSPYVVVRILALLKALRGLVDASTISLAETDARIVSAIWVETDKVVPKEIVRAAVGLPDDELEKALDRLIALQIIDIEDDTRIIKTEWMLMV